MMDDSESGWIRATMPGGLWLGRMARGLTLGGQKETHNTTYS